MNVKIVSIIIGYNGDSLEKPMQKAEKNDWIGMIIIY